MELPNELRTLKSEALRSKESGLSGATRIGISGIEGLTATQVQHALEQLAAARHGRNHGLFSGDHPDVDTADAPQDGDTLIWRAAAGKYAHEPAVAAVPFFSARSVLVVGGGAAQVWTDMPSGTTEFRGISANRFRLDLTGATQARIVANVATAGVTGSELFLQYSADNGTTWQAIAGATISAPLTPAGDRVSAWGPIPEGAKADVLLRLVGRNGNGVTDPAIGNVYLEVK